MMHRIYRGRICIIVPIIIAIILDHSAIRIGGHDAISKNSSTPGHLDQIEGRDGEFQLDKPNTSTLSARNSTTEIKPNDNPLKSRFKKTGVILTLSLRPKDQIRINDKPEITAPSSTSVMTSRISDLTEASFKLPTNRTNKKPYTILDRLRKLTNTKMRQSSGTDFGFKNVVALDDDNNEEDTTTTELPETVKGQITRIGGHLSHNSEIKSKPTLTLVLQPTTPPVTELPLEKLQTGSSDLDEDQIEQGETRYITADQIGGNRPTKEPFHFTTSTTTTEAATTPIVSKRPIKRYRKLHSPHNHIYAPTQDPINIAHNEDDLSVQDVQDYRAAHMTFGSKVGSGGVLPTTERPTLPTPPTDKVLAVTRPTVYRGLPPRSRSPRILSTKKTTVHPQSASSGVKNSHIKIKPSGDSTNDNLPFYKEPGGVFEHKYPDNDNEPNEVDNQYDNNVRAPAIKYAPKGPSVQPSQQPHIGYNSVNSQLQGYQNPPQPPVQHHQQRHYTGGPTPSPQYVTVTQQPIYLAPVPIQQQHHGIHPGPAYNTFQTPNPPHQNYYPQQQQQQQPYYPAPSPPQHSNTGPQYQFQNPPTYNPSPNVAVTPAYHVPTGYSPGPVQQLYAQPPVNNQNQNRFLHLNLPQTTPDYASQNIYNPPPSRYDPASDYYYGDPRPPAAATPKSKPLPSASPPRARASRNRVEDDEEEEEEEEEKYPAKKPKSNKGGNRRNSGRDRDQDRGRGRDREDANDKQEDDRGQEEEEDEERYEKPPKKSRKNSSRNNPNNYNREYDDEPLPSLARGGNREREPPRKQNPRPGYDDYDSDPNENIGEFVRPAELSERAYHDQRPNKEFVSLDNNFGGNTGRPLIPSERDSNFRPSPVDNGPNFEHPNIEYPRRGSPSQPEQRPQKRVDNYDNDDRFDTRHPPLDPIYTRTLQQYDEENTAPRDQGNVRPIEPDEEYPPPPYEVNEEQPHRPVSQRNRPVHKEERRPPPPQEEEEEEEEPEQRGQRQRGRPPPPNDDEEEEEDNRDQRDKGRPPARGQSQNDEEEEEPEAEEEDPKEKPQQEEEEQKPQEEEEEEEEEDENSNRRKSKRQPKEEKEKKPPPEKPKPEKSGDLDDDISAIEKEFGFTVPRLDLS